MTKSLCCAAILAAASACVAPRGPVIDKPYRKAAFDPPMESLRQCFDTAEAQRYLAEMHRKIISSWDIAYGTPRHEVIASISIDASGALLDAKILESPNQKFSDLALAAIHAAQPFGTVPEAASCLHAYPIKARFATRLGH